jgi:hypothetical protein
MHSTPAVLGYEMSRRQFVAGRLGDIRPECSCRALNGAYQCNLIRKGGAEKYH